MYIETCMSDVRKIASGVHQVSIVGPKLFILYVNDIRNKSKLVKYVLFADDANILQVTITIDEMKKQLTSWTKYIRSLQ